MGKLNKIPIGRRIDSFPAGTFNSLVDGEYRDRARAFPPQPVAQRESRSSVIVRLLWQGGSQLPAGACVVLGESIFDPDDDPSAPFTGLQFECDEATAADASEPFAINSTPINVGGVGYGHIPQACWAMVDVGDAADTHANIGAGLYLVSASGGRLPIIWKQSGTGVKWAIVSLSSAGSALRWGAVTTEITAATAWGTWGAGYYQEYDDAGATVGSPVEVDNWYPTPFAVDTVVCVDTSFSPPRVVSASCEVMPE